MLLLTLSAIISTSTHAMATSPHEVLPSLGLFLTALGLGGIWPCVPTFGADQFDGTDSAEKSAKELYYNWYFFSVNGGFFLASTLLVWIQENCGWDWGFGIPTVFSAVGVVGFLANSKLYRYQKPGGSMLTRICQVFVAAVRKLNVDVPNDSTFLYEMPGKESAIVGSRKLMHTDGLRSGAQCCAETLVSVNTFLCDKIKYIFYKSLKERLSCLITGSSIEQPPSLNLMKHQVLGLIHGGFALSHKWRS